MMNRQRVASRLLRPVGGLLLGLLANAGTAGAQTPWAFAGADIYDSHAMLSPSSGVNNPAQINPRTAPRLALKWSLATSGDISATPTVEPGGLYVPDWGGTLYKIDPATGAVIWSHKVSDYTGLANSISRTSPAIGASVVVIGDVTSHQTAATPGARVIAVNKATGAAAWTTVIDPAPYSIVTSSPVIYGNRVLVGMAAWDESAAYTDPNYVPSTRGAVVALDIATGAILWKAYTVPPGYTGGAVWGSSPAIWPAQNLVMVATGNNYSIPSAAAGCVKQAGNVAGAQLACLDPTDYVDSVVAIDLGTGRPRWSRRLQGADTWTLACISGLASCPSPQGPDFDFGSAPNLAWVPNFVGMLDDRGGRSANYLVGAGQKSGTYWGMNPINGGLFWSANVGGGGILWGSAVDTDDGRLIFASIDNGRPHLTNRLAGQNGVPITWNAGAWGGIAMTTGKMVWQIPSYGQDLRAPAFGSSAGGPNSFTNRVLFTGSSSGYFTALDATSGNRLWTYDSGGTVESAPAIFNETVFWGTGYTRAGGVSNHRLFAFAIP